MQLIINCDDFGMDEAINQAVYQAHQAGRLFSTSLIFDWHALDSAVDIARQCPALGVGLHLNLDPFLGFDIDGYYGNTLSNVNPAYYNQIEQKLPEIQQSIAGQFDRFFKLGLSMTHVDSHHNAHLLPAIFPLVVQIASHFQVQKMRFRRGFYEDNTPLYEQHRHLLQEHGFKTVTDFRDFGQPDALNQLNEGVTEMMAHLRTPGPHGQDWCVHQFERLMSAEAGNALQTQGAQLISYAAL